MLEGNYENGKHEGLWISWYSNSQKSLGGNYKYGNLEGHSIEYYKNRKQKETVSV